MYRGVRQAVIMVGGMGTRLRPLTYTRPKPILPVADKPCLSYLIDSFIRGGIEEIILACGYRSQQLAETIGNGIEKGIKIRYSYEEKPMGTGGAIKLLEKELDDVFIAANGDVFADMDLKKEIDVHLNNNADITLALTPVNNPWEFGTACMDNTGRITEFREKPKPEDVISNLINAGIYVVNKNMISYIPENEPYDFSKDLVPKKTAEGFRIWGSPLDGIWMDVGRLKDLIESNIVVAGRVESYGNTKNTSLSGNVFLGKDALVSNSTITDVSIMNKSSVTDSLINKSAIMPSCIVQSSKIIGSVIGENAKIVNCNIKNSIIGDNAILENEDISDSGGS